MSLLIHNVNRFEVFLHDFSVRLPVDLQACLTFVLAKVIL